MGSPSSNPAICDRCCRNPVNSSSQIGSCNRLGPNLPGLGPHQRYASPMAQVSTIAEQIIVAGVIRCAITPPVPSHSSVVVHAMPSSQLVPRSRHPTRRLCGFITKLDMAVGGLTCSRCWRPPGGQSRCHRTLRRCKRRCRHRSYRSVFPRIQRQHYMHHCLYIRFRRHTRFGEERGHQ